MGLLGTIGVVNRVNTSDGLVVGLSALGGLGGAGISTTYLNPAASSHILSQLGAILNTQTSDKLIIQ